MNCFTTIKIKKSASLSKYLQINTFTDAFQLTFYKSIKRNYISPIPLQRRKITNWPDRNIIYISSHHSSMVSTAVWYRFNSRHGREFNNFWLKGKFNKFQVRITLTKILLDSHKVFCPPGYEMVSLACRNVILTENDGVGKITIESCN